MKKILLLAFTSITIGAFAQRNCDISIELTTPADGGSFSSSTVTLTGVITNNGSDALEAGDSIITFIVANNSIVPNSELLTLINNTVNSGETIPFPYEGGILGLNGGDDWSLCVVAFAINGNSIADAESEYIGSTTPNNNTDCNMITLNAVGIGETRYYKNNESVIAISAYPNPTATSTQISYNLTNSDNVNLSILDITGKRIMNVLNEKQSSGAHSVNLNITELPAGIYFCELTVGSKKSVSKLVVTQ